MHRRGFFRALAGVLVAAPAATALVLAAPQTVQKFEPRPSVPGDHQIAKLLAYEFLRVLIFQLGTLERQPMLTTQRVFELWQFGMPRQLCASIEWHPKLNFDQLADNYVRAAASAVAEHLHDEYQRGARGLQFYRPQIALGAPFCEIVTSPEARISARFIVASWPSIDENDELEWLTRGRFDVGYYWDVQPRRARRHYALDPARLPA